MSSYLSRTVALVVASVATQAIQFVGALVAARLYGPVEVGVLGLFMAILGFAQIASSWRYELAIVTADEEDHARDVAVFVVAAGAAAMVAGFGLVLAFNAVSGLFEISSALVEAIGVLPVAVVLTSFNLAGSSLCSRERRFGRIALQQVATAVVTVSMQAALVGSSLFGSGLVTGTVIGQLGGAAVVAYPLFPAVVHRVRLDRLGRRLREVAYAHRNYFFYTNPYGLLTQLYFQMPLLLMGSLFGLKAAGFFSLAYRTSSAPVGLVPQAVAQVLFPELARDRQRLGQWEAPIQGIILALGILMAPGVALYMAAGPDIFALLLGEPWREAGVMAQILIVPTLVMGLATGADRLYWVLSRQRVAMLVMLGGVAASALLMLAAEYFGTPADWFVGIWAAVHIAFSTLWIAIVHRIAGFSVARLLWRLAAIVAIVGLLSAAMCQWREVWHGEPWAILLAVAALVSYTPVALRGAAQLKNLLRQGEHA